MPRWLSRWIDPRALSNEGQWGQYKCERCGRIFAARMCTKKRAKHVYCSTKCKKEAQVNYNRPKIENKIFKNLYLKKYKLVQRCAFQLCEGNKMKLQFMEDCMQYGFIELWKTYNRNGMKCSDKYIEKAVRHAMICGVRYWFDKQKRLILADEFDIQLMADKINGGIYDR